MKTRSYWLTPALCALALAGCGDKTEPVDEDPVEEIAAPPPWVASEANRAAFERVNGQIVATLALCRIGKDIIGKEIAEGDRNGAYQEAVSAKHTCRGVDFDKLDTAGIGNEAAIKAVKDSLNDCLVSLETRAQSYETMENVIDRGGGPKPSELMAVETDFRDADVLAEQCRQAVSKAASEKGLR